MYIKRMIEERKKKKNILCMLANVLFRIFTILSLRAFKKTWVRKNLCSIVICLACVLCAYIKHVHRCTVKLLNLEHETNIGIPIIHLLHWFLFFSLKKYYVFVKTMKSFSKEKYKRVSF